VPILVEEHVLDAATADAGVEPPPELGPDEEEDDR
jgi:hypothetical protein